MEWIILLVFGFVCAAIASSKGRNVVGWFILGFIAPLLGIILILCLSNLKEEQAHRNQQSEENRRLREKLRQEQMKLESLRAHTAERLDRHDQALGMDTRQTTPEHASLGYGGGYAAAGIGAPPPMPGGAVPPVHLPDGVQWFYVIEGHQYGPVTRQDLRALIASGQAGWSTLAWNDRLPNWVEAGKLPEFNDLTA